MALDLSGLRNVGEFYSQHYLEAVLEGDLKATLKGWANAEKEGGPKDPANRLTGLTERYFKAVTRCAEFAPSGSGGEQNGAREAELGHLTRRISEAQDFRSADLNLLRAIVPKGANDIFVVGDAHQRIYGHEASLGRCGISIQGRRSRHLKVNYRTTHQIRNWAVGLLHGIEIDDLDEELGTLRGERSLLSGPAPEVRVFDSADAEGAFIVERIKQWIDGGVDPEKICLATRQGNSLGGRYLPMLEQAEIEAVQIKTTAGEALGPGVRVATMHHVKGLEFSRVVLASIHDGELPLAQRRDRLADDVSRAAFDVGERKLLYVAATRAREELVVCGFGKQSSLLERPDS